MWNRIKAGPHHRARVLILLGIIWVIIGIGILTQPPRRVGLIYEQLPLEARALIWILPGLAGVIGALWRRLDSLAWGVLIVPAAERASAYLWAWAIGTVHAAYLGFGVYAALGLLVYECAAGLDRPRNGEVGAWVQKV